MRGCMQLAPLARAACTRALASSSDTRRQWKYMAGCVKRHPPLGALALRYQTRKEIIQRGLRGVAQAAVHR
jgi:hypothetical protein